MKAACAALIAYIASTAAVVRAEAQTAHTTHILEIEALPTPETHVESPAWTSGTLHKAALAPPDSSGGSDDQGFRLGPAILQTAGFTMFQHLVRLREAKTRNELEGAFFDDWFTAASHTGRSWSDGGKIFTNYIAHPMGGAVYANIYRQNDPRRRDLRVGEDGYGGMVLRALLFSAIASVQFELGPLSEASIGNVGLRDPRKMAWVDFVITPTLGTVWMIGEDVIDERVLTRMDSQNMVLRNTVRFFLNPSRSAANLSRAKWPWYRTRDIPDERN
jgi:hypothetical protein